jgi:hypothetical protein
MFRLLLPACVLAAVLLTGCEMIPRRYEQPRFFNPFPQLNKVAVLPFFNQSSEPTLSGREVAEHYRGELQKIPGFEVMPIGVVERYLEDNPVPLGRRVDFQKIARDLNVDAVVVGSVTDFTPYYPPRLGLAVNWYAANPCLHPIPPGYGLPWDTADEEAIPHELKLEAEFALAKAQLNPRTPRPTSSECNDCKLPESDPDKHAVWPGIDSLNADHQLEAYESCQVQHDPVMSLIKQYDANDGAFTAKLEDYYDFRDDQRFAGWEGYLQRKQDFIRFCCYLHVTEMLAARGGVDKSRVVWKYEPDR